VPNTRTHKTEPLQALTPPDTVSDLRHWIREQLPLSQAQQDSLLQAVDHVIARHEAMWQASKQEALQAMSTGFSDRMRRMREELAARETTVSSITKYFEQLVADLTDRAHRDPKTRLMNFRRFIERLEQFLETEQRGHWCAVGLVDIRSFKKFNDTYGHALGDRIIERVARLLCEQIRAQDIVAQDGSSDESHELHARFGGDEFCFLIPDLTDAHDGWVIAERFRTAVERHDWTREDERLTPGCVSVDVGVVSLKLGPVEQRRLVARQLAHDLLAKADRAMYMAKMEKAQHVEPVRVRIDEGVLAELAAEGAAARELAT
jgi:diguanylate cyclase (GGDEF)-like protein